MPTHPQALLEQAYALHRGGQLGEARRLYEALLQSDPRHAPALHLLGLLATQRGQAAQAVDLIRQAIAIDGNVADYHLHLGLALSQLDQPAAARDSLDRASALGLQSPLLQAARAHTYFSHGVALTVAGQRDAAISSYDEAIGIKPDYAAAYANRGVLLAQLGRLQQAVASHSQSLQIDPRQAQVLANRGHAYFLLNQLPEAARDFEQALALDPDHDFVAGYLFHIKRQMGQWDDHAARLAELEAGVMAGRKVAPPFVMLAASASPAIHRLAAATWINALHPADGRLGPINPRQRDGKIRLAYYSADFHQHATAYLIAELFELHDRSQFDVFAFSFGPPSTESMRKRIVSAVDRFIDVSTLPDLEVARLSRELGIDIAVDLKGITQDARPGIFACRAAPVQVSYLGYPATMGAHYIDYAIADKIVIPPADARHFAEQVVTLPGCYQVNDRLRAIADRAWTREEMGLPPEGVVYCCFNNTYKITPEMFACWMRILHAVPGSVLWLLEDNAAAVQNLRGHASCLGIGGERLIFAQRMPLDLHLARHRLADLFLDTLPYNAHTTASDALWAGLPVLTCPGNSFAGRVAASLLHAVGLPDLVMASIELYEAEAIRLGRQGCELAGIRDRLWRNCANAPLFDAPAFAQGIEVALRAMLDHAERGLAPMAMLIGGKCK